MIYDNMLKQDPCTNITKMYVLATADLIGKYYWLSYFGTGQGRNFLQLVLRGTDQQGNLVYENPVYRTTVILAIKDNKLVPVINVPQRNIRNAIVEEIIFFQNNQPYQFKYTNVTNTVGGLLWVDPSFRSVIYMEPAIRDSLFVRMFFFSGEGLEHFQLVYFNPEVKIFKVVF